MDRQERYGDSQNAILAAINGNQTGIWTALPGIIQSFDPAKRTVVVQPTIRSRAQKKDGSFEWLTLPLLLDCPVFFPSGGGVTMTFPIKNGDECLVVFASRCIDGWWQSSGIQNQADIRMHDLSDGIAYVGISSVPKVISDISTSVAQFRSDDHEAFVEIDPDSHFVRVKTTGKIELNADDDILIKSGTRVDIQAPIIASVATVSQTVQAPILSFRGNMTWTSVSGGAGTHNINGQNLNFSNNAITYTNGTMTYNGKNITNTHTHVGVTTGAGTSGAVT